MDAFQQRRTWERARRLGLSQLVCLGRHTVTGVLCTCGRQFVDWSADYRLFSKDRWEPEALFVPVVRGVLDRLVDDEAPFVAALDDTLLRKTGPKIPGVGYRRDPLSPPFHTNLVRAQRFMQLSACLPAGDRDGSARAIPVRFAHSPSVPKPKKSAPDEAQRDYREARKTQNLNAHAVRLFREMRDELDGRHDAVARMFLVTVDGSYTNKTVLRGLPPRTTLVGRIRKDAKLFHLPADADQPAVGAKRRYGAQAPTPEALRQDDTVPWQEVTAFGAGKVHTFRVKTLAPVLWKKAGAEMRLRMVVIAPVGYRPRKGSKLLYRKPAYLICTDPDLPLERLIQYYLWRWDIEVNHRDEKQIVGVGEAQVRSPRSVDRQPALAVASYAMLLLAADRAFGENVDDVGLPVPKWQRHLPQRRLSTDKLMQQLRNEVWAYALDQLDANSSDFVTTAPPDAKSPKLELPLADAVLYAYFGCGHRPPWAVT